MFSILKHILSKDSDCLNKSQNPVTTSGEMISSRFHKFHVLAKASPPVQDSGRRPSTWNGEGPSYSQEDRIMAVPPPGPTQKAWVSSRVPTHSNTSFDWERRWLWRFSQAKFTPPIFLFWNLREVCEWQASGLHKKVQNSVSTSEMFASTSSCLDVWVCLENALKKSQNFGKGDFKSDQVKLPSLGRVWNKGAEEKEFFCPRAHSGTGKIGF